MQITQMLIELLLNGTPEAQERAVRALRALVAENPSRPRGHCACGQPVGAGGAAEEWHLGGQGLRAVVALAVHLDRVAGDGDRRRAACSRSSTS